MEQVVDWLLLGSLFAGALLVAGLVAVINHLEDEEERRR